MQLDDLKSAVQASLSEDFDTAFARFREEQGSDDLMEFLLDLVERDMLGPEALQAINKALPLLEDGTLASDVDERAPDDGGDLSGADEGTLADQEQQQGDDADADEAEDEEPGEDEDDQADEDEDDEAGTGTGTRRRRRRRRAESTTGGQRRVRRRTEDGAPPRTRRPGGSHRGRGNDKVGRGYDFIGFVGEGAMGKVRLAKDLDLQRVVAYKEMSEEIQRNKVLAAKFYAEAQITAQLDHPNIVPIYALEETDTGALAYSMKLIKGKTLEKLVEECWEFYDDGRPLDEEHNLNTRLDQFLKVCEAMHYAHSRGVVHRDLKPENIMIGPYGEVYVMDWGIAKVFDPPAGKTPTAWVTLEDEQKPEGEIIIGTPQYMSPEQADGVTDGLSPASDQYSMGLILYELLSLKQAVTGKTPMAIITRQTEGDKEPFSHYGGDKVPAELRAIIDKSTALDPDARYDDVHDLAEDIRRFQRGEETMARPDNMLQKLLRWMQHHRELTLLGIVFGFLAFTVVTAGTQIYYQYQRIQQAAREQALTDVLTEVGTQAAIIDGNFVRYEGLLGVLSASSVEMLSQMNPGDPEIYWAEDFEQGTVPHMVESTYYSMPVSLEFPVNVLANDADPIEGTANLKRLAPMRRYYENILLRSHSEQAATYTQARAERLIRDVGVPIAWAHIGLRDGAYSGYPGHAGFNEIFDPRQAPWYELAEDEKIPRWGSPSIDPNGLGLILPCAKALYNDDDEFLGVAAIELTFDYIIEELLEIGEFKGHSEAFLLTDEGKTVIRSSKKGKEYRGSSLRARKIRMPEFDNGKVVDAIQDRESGYVETWRDDEKHLIVYQRMSTLGWYYVVQGKSSDLLK